MHYRWHALYGRCVRRQYVERRAGGDVVHVEVAPGIVIVMAAWMLDPAACAGMGLGAPRVTLAALAELHQLLTERGFRRSSQDDPTIVQEEQHEELARPGSAIRGMRYLRKEIILPMPGVGGFGVVGDVGWPSDGRRSRRHQQCKHKQPSARCADHPGGLIADTHRSKARRAIAAGACSGIAKHELTLISLST